MTKEQQAEIERRKAIIQAELDMIANDPQNKRVKALMDEYLVKARAILGQRSQGA